MNTRSNKQRIYHLLYDRFHGRTLWRSAEEQAWQDVAPVGREFGSPDYERLQILDIHFDQYPGHPWARPAYRRTSLRA